MVLLDLHSYDLTTEKKTNKEVWSKTCPELSIFSNKLIMDLWQSYHLSFSIIDTAFEFGC